MWPGWPSSIGLMLATGPWDWALAASLGVLLAGLVQWPWWRLAAVGAVLCLVAGTGWGVDRYRVAQEKAAQEAQRSQENMSQLGERSPDRVLPALVEGIGQGDVVGVCGLLAEPARNQFANVAGTPDCASAVAHFHSALPRVPPLRGLAAPVAATARWGDRRRLPHRLGVARSRWSDSGSTADREGAAAGADLFHQRLRALRRRLSRVSTAPFSRRQLRSCEQSVVQARRHGAADLGLIRSPCSTRCPGYVRWNVSTCPGVVRRPLDRRRTGT